MKRTRKFVAVWATALALAGVGGGPASAQPAVEPPVVSTTPPFTTPNTDACPFAASPPPAIDSSEVPAPGSTAPQPVPIPADPVGGSRLAECGA
ncbi:MAG: penicillin-binding protein, partial [Rhodococcus sp.]|nr:penicillin-binding protein [Rhodococcus sp. (in: high G+C Gram-positive bacteria)]